MNLSWTTLSIETNNQSLHSVQFSSVTQSCLTLQPHGLQRTRLPCPSPTPVHMGLLRLISIELVMPSNHLILIVPFSSCLQILPSIRVFSNESILCIRWPEYWSFSFSISSSNEYSGLISFRINWLDLLAVQGTSGVFSCTTVQKHQFFSTQPSLWSDSLRPPWTAVCQASLSFTISWSLLKLMSIESVMLLNHLILCRLPLLLPSIFPSIRVFSNVLALRIRWLKYWSFSFSITPSSEYSGLTSFRMDWLDLLAVQGTLKSPPQHHSSKASILWHSAFFIVQLLHPYMTTGKTVALTRWTFIWARGKSHNIVGNPFIRSESL